MGVQLNARVTSKLSAVLQVIAQQRYDNTYTPEIEWANIKYELTPDISVRVGRIALSIFMSADYRNVGYANVWAHPPQEMYNQLPVTNSDGVDVTWGMHFGRVDNSLQLLYGGTSVHAPEASEVVKVKVSGMSGVFDTIEYGAFTARAGYDHLQVQFGPAPSQFTIGDGL